MRANELQQLLVPFYTYFLVRTDDTRQVKKDKMRLLRTILNQETHQALLREFIVSCKYEALPAHC